MTPEPKGAYNRMLVFNSENYGYLKDCIRVHINSIDRIAWNTIQSGPFESTTINVNGVVVPKSEAQWNASDEKNWLCDWKAKNILISTLGVGEYYCISHYTTAKAMCYSLQVAREGTNEVK